MKFNHIMAIIALGSLSLAGCGQPAAVAPESPAPQQDASAAPQPDASAAPQPQAPAMAAAALPCGISAHRDWQATLSTGGRPTLTLSGKIDLPTPGYAVSLGRDPADSPTATEPHLLLTAAAPSGPANDVITAHPVYYFAPATGAYTIVHIMCDGQAVTDINVTSAQ